MVVKRVNAVFFSLGLTEKIVGVGHMTIAYLLGDFSGMYGVFFREEICECGRIFLRNLNYKLLHCYRVAFPKSHGIKVC